MNKLPQTSLQVILSPAALVLLEPVPVLADEQLGEVHRLGPHRVLKDMSGTKLERLLQPKGWHIIWLLPRLTARTLALNPERALRRAYHQLLRQTQQQAGNLLEIESIRQRSLLRLHYITVWAKRFRIQPSQVAFGQSQPLPSQSRPSPP